MNSAIYYTQCESGYSSCATYNASLYLPTVNNFAIFPSIRKLTNAMLSTILKTVEQSTSKEDAAALFIVLQTCRHCQTSYGVLIYYFVIATMFQTTAII